MQYEQSLFLLNSLHCQPDYLVPDNKITEGKRITEEVFCKSDEVFYCLSMILQITYPEKSLPSYHDVDKFTH